MEKSIFLSRGHCVNFMGKPQLPIKPCSHHQMPPNISQWEIFHSEQHDDEQIYVQKCVQNTPDPGKIVEFSKLLLICIYFFSV